MPTGELLTVVYQLQKYRPRWTDWDGVWEVLGDYVDVQDARDARMRRIAEHGAYRIVKTTTEVVK